MTFHVSAHLRSTDAIEVRVSETHAWLEVWPGLPIWCDDATTAERVAAGFADLAAKMRERRGLPEPTRELVEFG